MKLSILAASLCAFTLSLAPAASEANAPRSLEKTTKVEREMSKPSKKAPVAKGHRSGNRRFRPTGHSLGQ